MAFESLFNNAWRSFPTRFQFFYIFSVFEYALKAEGFFRKQKDAPADWRAFAEECDELNQIEDEHLQKAITFLRDHAPQQQVNHKGLLGWKALGSLSTSNIDITRIVKCVRNNLFHGGKVPYLPRYDDLAAASLIALNAFLIKMPGVAERFYDPM